jgi:hypothetical protein
VAGEVMVDCLDFVCVGAQKSGTTTLHEILLKHERVVLPNVKETKFFHDDDRSQYSNGIEWYFHKYFCLNTQDKVVGEIDPDYLYFDDVPERLFQHNKDLKLIVILRNPAERAYSHYLMSKSRGIENSDFNHALLLEQSRLKNGEYNQNHYSYYSRGKYYNQVRRYMDLFSRDNIMFLEFREFLDFSVSLPKIYEFIGLSDSDGLENVAIHSNRTTSPRNYMLSKFINAGGTIRGKMLSHLLGDNLKLKMKKYLMNFNSSSKVYPKMDNEIYLELMESYRSDVNKLAKLTGIDFVGAWYDS